MVGWIMANSYPMVTSAAMFDRLGVDWRAAPMLDDNDAYAAVSAAIWYVLGQITIDEIRFINCVGGGQHPKSERLRAAALGLIAMA
ncbi:MAG TPA: thioester domain-containing protein, partial [Clostridia bacterium]|nr:thioester domain-containing protein [Clostridia bacterium]